MNDTHSLWVDRGFTPEVPAKAKKAKIDPELGFAAIREDLGGGFNDMTYVFSKRLSGPALKKAFVRSVIYGHLLHDFFFLSAAGNDWAERTDDGLIDATTAVVPDEYDPLYAKCGSGAATDTSHHALLRGVQLLGRAARGGTRTEAIMSTRRTSASSLAPTARSSFPRSPTASSPTTTRPHRAADSALFQMLARFEKVDVSMAAMGSQEETQEDKNIDDARGQAQGDQRKRERRRRRQVAVCETGQHGRRGDRGAAARAVAGRS